MSSERREHPPTPLEAEAHDARGSGEALASPNGNRVRSASATAPSRLSGLTIFLPSYNEEGNVERVVRGFLAEAPNVAEDFEILVIDDGSRDRTAEIAARLAVENPRVRLVRHGLNRGYGCALATGFKTARQPYVLLCDGDGQFDPADMARLTALIANYDVVIGRRARRADHLMRRFNGKAWTILSRLLFGLSVTDMDCGFKLFRREIVADLELHASGAMITTELMARLAGRKARIAEVDVTHLPRIAGVQGGNSPSVIIGAFRDLLSLYWELKRARYGE